MKKILQRIQVWLTPPDREPLTQNKMIIISILFGFLGVDRYLMGYHRWWLKPLTLGGFWMWYWYDIIMITLGKLTMADKRPLIPQE